MSKTTFKPKFFVRHPRTGQFLKLDPKVKGFGWRWTFDRDDATSFSVWHPAFRLSQAKHQVVDQLGDVWTKARAFNKGVYS